jgi:transposase-like protein
MVNPASHTIFLTDLHYWVHKTANVLNKLPTSIQPKTAVQTTWMAEMRKDARRRSIASSSFTKPTDKAVGCLKKDRDVLLEFYDFPTEHWKHLRTTKPIESIFATVRHRTIRSRGCLCPTFRAAISSNITMASPTGRCGRSVIIVSISPTWR